MLRTIVLTLFLGGCSSVLGADEAAKVADMCSLETSSSTDVVVIRAEVETDGHHGMFLGSRDCRFRLKVGKSAEVPDSSVDEFMAHVSGGQHLEWRKYVGEFSGRLILEDSRKRFDILHVHWFRDERAGAEADVAPGRR